MVNDGAPTESLSSLFTAASSAFNDCPREIPKHVQMHCCACERYSPSSTSLPSQRSENPPLDEPPPPSSRNVSILAATQAVDGTLEESPLFEMTPLRSVPARGGGYRAASSRSNGGVLKNLRVLISLQPLTIIGMGGPVAEKQTHPPVRVRLEFTPQVLGKATVERGGSLLDAPLAGGQGGWGYQCRDVVSSTAGLLYFI